MDAEYFGWILCTDILITIFTLVCSTHIPVDSNRLLDHLEDKSWQKELINYYVKISQVCMTWDNIMCNMILLPYHRVRAYYHKTETETLFFTRFHNVKCLNIICVDKPLQSFVLLSDKTTHIVWNNKLEKYPDIMANIKFKLIRTIGFMNYGHLVAEYQKERDYHDRNIQYYQEYVPILNDPKQCSREVLKWLVKYMPNNIQSLAKIYSLLSTLKRADELLRNTLRTKVSCLDDTDQDKTTNIQLFNREVFKNRTNTSKYETEQIIW